MNESDAIIAYIERCRRELQQRWFAGEGLTDKSEVLKELLVNLEVGEHRRPTVEAEREKE
jgi:hypothetical protein